MAFLGLEVPTKKIGRAWPIHLGLVFVGSEIGTSSNLQWLHVQQQLRHLLPPGGDERRMLLPNPLLDLLTLYKYIYDIGVLNGF